MFIDRHIYVECGSWTYIPEEQGGLNDGDRYHRQNTEKKKNEKNRWKNNFE